MTTTSILERIWNARGAERLQRARARARAALAALDERGIEARVVGSLARGTFTAFSDVDFVIFGDRATWSRAVNVIDREMGGIAVDILLASAIPDDIAPLVLKGALDEAGLRARGARFVPSGV